MRVGEALLATLVILLLVGVYVYAILHAVQHRRYGIVILLFAVPALAWLWIPFHHHRPAPAA